jgi:hypothetical protein
VPRRGPEAGVRRVQDDFYGSGVNQIDLCLFLQNRFFLQTIELDLDKLILHRISSLCSGNSIVVRIRIEMIEKSKTFSFKKNKIGI